MLATIFSTPLNRYKPIHRGGTELYRYADQLRSLLSDRLGEPYCELLAIPLITEDAKHFNDNAHWRSAYVATPKPLPQLPPEQQQKAAQKLQQYLQEINTLAAQLQTEADSKIRELGDYLAQSVQIPSIDCVLVENDRIVLVLWAFASDESQKKNFTISKVLEDYRAKSVPEIPQVPEVATARPIATEPAPIAATTIQPTVAAPKKRRFWRWLLWALLLLLVLVLASWAISQCSSNRNAFIPNNPDAVQPVDPGKTRTDPDDRLGRTLVTNRLLLLLDKQQTMLSFADELAARYKPEQIKITHFNPDVNLAQVTFADTNYARWKQELRQLPGVVTIIPEYLVGTQEMKIPTDPFFASPANSYHFKHVRAYEAWSLTMGSADVLVAVVDGGLDVNHAELRDKIVNPFDVVPTSKLIQLLPGEEHGTHVAGLAVGAAYNNQGASGIAPGCKLIPIQVSDAGLGHEKLSIVNIIAGLSYAVKNGARVVNISLGASFDSTLANRIKQLSPAQQEQIAHETLLEEEVLWQELYAYARRNNVIVVKSAGNDGLLATLDPMNRSNDIILVGATDHQDQLTSFSNYGSHVTVCAPGAFIFSSLPGNRYAQRSGTSMSAPIVAGGVALMLSRNSELTLEQIKQILTETGSPVKSMEERHVGPLIQLAEAVVQAGSPPPLHCDCQPTIDSLHREIDRLNQVSEGQPVMKMPAQPLNCSFATGKWHSTNPLVNESKEPIELFFAFNGQCDGVITFVEMRTNINCTAPILMSIDANNMEMKQTAEAPCNQQREGSRYTYRQHKFTCQPNAQGEVECIETTSKTRFKLTKQ